MATSIPDISKSRNKHQSNRVKEVCFMPLRRVYLEYIEMVSQIIEINRASDVLGRVHRVCLEMSVSLEDMVLRLEGTLNANSSG